MQLLGNLHKDELSAGNKKILGGDNKSTHQCLVYRRWWNSSNDLCILGINGSAAGQITSWNGSIDAKPQISGNNLVWQAKDDGSDYELRYVINEYMEHYHTERPHQGIGNTIIEPLPQPKEGKIVCQERLGGLLKSYRRAA